MENNSAIPQHVKQNYLIIQQFHYEVYIPKNWKQRHIWTHISGQHYNNPISQSIDECIIKMWYSALKGEEILTHADMDEPYKHARWNKPGTGGKYLWFHSYEAPTTWKLTETERRRAERERTGNQCLLGTEFHFGKMEKFRSCTEVLLHINVDVLNYPWTVHWKVVIVENSRYTYRIHMYVLIAQLCPTFCDPMDCSPPGSFIHEISQTRILEWVAIPFSRGSSWLRDQTQVSFIAGRFFIIWATREADIHKLQQKHFQVPCCVFCPFFLLIYKNFSFENLCFWSWHASCRILAPQPRIKPGPQ